jgi:hypothetical protein
MKRKREEINESFLFLFHANFLRYEHDFIIDTMRKKKRKEEKKTSFVMVPITS